MHNSTFCLTFLMILLLSLYSCDDFNPPYNYPAGKGFDVKGSDKKAIEIANKVVESMGGYDNFQKIRYYIIFGSSTILCWDRHKGLVRGENYPNSRYEDTYIYNTRTNTAIIKNGDRYYTNPDSINLYRNTIRNIFEIESYHILLPFKMKDSGVTLKYLGEVRKLPNGHLGEKLQLTFNNVGRVPTAKFHVFVDKTDYKINHYEFYRHVNDKKFATNFRMDMYKKERNIYLSYNRSDSKGPRKVILPDSIPAIIFQDITFNPSQYIKEVAGNFEF